MHDVFIINKSDHNKNINELVQQFPFAKTIQPLDNNINTIKHCVSLSKTKFVWILSDCCDYKNFDFDFIPPPWEADQIHAWVVDDINFGDTFLIPRAEFQTQQNIEKIEQYKFISWHTEGKPFYLNKDIFFISNGEPNEKEYFDIACKRSKRPVTWVNGINNRTDAIKYAANLSSTDWFFLIPAKLKIVENFDWTWYPDYKSEPRHYVFYAENPVTGLIYGHMAMIAYNKKLVLATDNPGLDFTMSKPHEIVPTLSGIANFNQNPLTTYRTAFREVVKLKHYTNTTNNYENQSRLDTWLTKANGKYADYSLLGANDAIEYYDSVQGDLTKLELTYTWQWIDQFIKNKGYQL